MKILIVNRFFGGAQIPTGRMAEDVARVLVDEGHEVTALASTGTYAGAEKRGGDESRVTGGGWNAAAHSAESDTEPKHRTTESPKHRSTLRVEQVRVPKWMPRSLAWVWFTWQARKRIPQMDWDVCVLMTDPPLLPLLAARVKAADGPRDHGTAESARRVAMQPTDTGPRDATRRVAVWLMDLYPEALAASGRIGTENSIYRWYFSKRQKALGSADLLICLGHAQKELLGEALTKKVRTAVVPPWDDREEVVRADDRRLEYLALYAGNLGEAHCFEEILAAAPHLPADWTIRFAVRGAKFAALRAKASSREFSHSRPQGTADGPEANSVRHSRGQVNASQKKASHGWKKMDTDTFSAGDTGGKSLPWEITAKSGAVVHVSGYASEQETPGLLASARVHLITMSPGWEGIVVPSKLYGCIRTGRPVLFIGPENADTAREIRAHDWGKVLPPGSSGEEVAAAILELAARPTRAPQLQHGAGEIAALLVATAGLQDNGLTGQQE